MPRPSPDEVWWWVLPATAFAGAEVAASDEDRIARIGRADERARAAATSVLLRRAVAWAAAMAEADVRVERRCHRCGRTGHGKPSFPGSGVEASVSRSGAFVAAAVALRPVGIDVESVAGAPAGAWRLEDWVRVESVLKATGDGVAVEPRSIVFAGTARDRRVRGYDGGPLAAATADLPLGDAAVGALTLLGDDPVQLRRGDPLAVRATL